MEAIGFCTQLGNIFPILYKLIFKGSGRINATIGASQLLAMGTLVLCAFTWNVRVAGHSVFVILCATLAGGVGCISNVTYWAAAMSFPANCTRAMSVGMTFGGLITNLLAIAQQSGAPVKSPRVPVWAYCLFAAAMQGLQFIAFAVQARQNSRASATEPLNDGQMGRLCRHHRHHQL